MLNLDILTIVAFSLLVVGCGMAFSGAGKDMKSFFAGGGAVPWWISGLSLFMSFFSAGTFVVWGAIAYRYGWVAIAIQWTMSISGFIIGFVVAPRWQRTRVLTAAEFITRRLGYPTQKIYSYLFLTISIFTTGAFLYPVAKILEVYTGIPVALTTILIGGLILLYTATGGMWAVVITDVLQFIVLTAAVLIVVPLALQRVGGTSAFVRQAPAHFFDLFNQEYSLGFLIAFGLYNLFFLSGNWTYVQRYTTVKDPRAARKVGWLFGALYVVSPVIWMLPPMIYRLINPGLTGLDNEGAYLLICQEILPTGIMGLMLGGMVFATSSSVNTTLNITAGVFTNDLFKPLFPHSSQKRLIRVARITTILLGLLAIGMALLVPSMGGIVEVVISLGALTGAAIYLPPLWALFSRRQTGRSVLLVTLVSLVINLFFKFLSPALLGLSLSRGMEMIVGVAVPILLLALLEATYAGRRQVDPAYLRYRENEQAREEATTARPDPEEEAGNRRGKRILAIGVLVTGLLLTALGTYALQRTWYVLAAGLLVVLTGLAMLLGARAPSYTHPAHKSKSYAGERP